MQFFFALVYDRYVFDIRRRITCVRWRRRRRSYWSGIQMTACRPDKWE